MGQQLHELLKIEKGITAVIGGGGKTTLINSLAEELRHDGKVIICTTTKICPPENVRLICPDDSNSIREALAKAGEPVICVAGSMQNSRKLDMPNTPLDELETMADYILVEADGSKQLPLKAHASHEPVIPKNATQTILVMGVDGIGKSISKACHRPELYVQKLAEFDYTKCSKDFDVEKLVNTSETVVTPEIAMKVIKAENFGTRIYINKVEHENEWKVVAEMAAETELPVVAGSLWKGEYRCL